eukprot:GHVS01068904.1.p1 GENE.GHVS01068904.1~~GHVS01068904.1.p1  ORF type:complete len:101 (+),score=2.97 GHVS01068904.1:830-1132(+)
MAKLLQEPETTVFTEAKLRGHTRFSSRMEVYLWVGGFPFWKAPTTPSCGKAGSTSSQRTLGPAGRALDTRKAKTTGHSPLWVSIWTSQSNQSSHSSSRVA